jgi:hypothetical protein
LDCKVKAVTRNPELYPKGVADSFFRERQLTLSELNGTGTDYELESDDEEEPEMLFNETGTIFRHAVHARPLLDFTPPGEDYLEEPDLNVSM